MFYFINYFDYFFSQGARNPFTIKPSQWRSQAETDWHFCSTKRHEFDDLVTCDGDLSRLNKTTERSSHLQTCFYQFVPLPVVVLRPACGPWSICKSHNLLSVFICHSRSSIYVHHFACMQFKLISLFLHECWPDDDLTALLWGISSLFHISSLGAWETRRGWLFPGAQGNKKTGRAMSETLSGHILAWSGA